MDGSVVYGSLPLLEVVDLAELFLCVSCLSSLFMLFLPILEGNDGEIYSADERDRHLFPVQRDFACPFAQVAFCSGYVVE